MTHRLARWGLVLLLVLAVAHSAAAAEGETVELKGTVRTTADKPVRDVTVTVSFSLREPFLVPGVSAREEVQVTSDARGHFTLTVPKDAGSVRLDVKAPAASGLRLEQVLPATVLLRATGGTPVELEIVMKPGSKTLSGKVADEAARPVKGATVAIVRTGSGSTYSGWSWREQLEAVTSRQGVYRFDKLLSGDYSIISVVPPRGSGLVPMAQSWRGHGGVRVPSDRADGYDFTLKPGCSIRGRVLDEDAKPVADAQVSASRAGAAIDGPNVYGRMGNFSDTTHTDADGRYVLEGLTPETYQVTVSGPDDSPFAPSHPLTGLRAELGKPLTCQDIVLVRGGELAGTVTGADGKPLADVAVYYGQWHTTTDAEGRYRLTCLATGVHDVKLIPPMGSVWASATAEGVPVVAKLKVKRDWVLEAGGTVSGTVTGEDGKPIASAAVRAGFGNYSYTTTTDEAGRYRLAGLVENSGVDYKKRPQRYGLSVRTPGDSPYMAGGQPFDVKLGEDVRQDVTLKLGGAIGGKVTSSGGKPVAGARIGIFKKVGRGGRAYYGGTGMGPGPGVTTDADGRFVVRQLPPDWFNVSVDPPEEANVLSTEKAGVGVEAGETTDVQLALRAGGVVSGILTDSGGRALEGADVTLQLRTSARRATGRRQIRPVTTDARGGYRFVGLPGGSYRIQVRLHDGKHVVAPRDVDVTEGDEIKAALHALKGAFIEVKVGDPSGKAVQNASVRASADPKTGGSSAYGRSDTSGVAKVGPLLPGTYTLTISARSDKKNVIFKPATVSDVTVRQGQRLTRRVKLEEGEAPTPRRPGRGAPGGPPTGGAG